MILDLHRTCCFNFYITKMKDKMNCYEFVTHQLEGVAT